MTARPTRPAFQVNTNTDYLHRYPAIATDAQGNYVIAWTSGGSRFDPFVQSPDGSVSGVYAQRFRADGTPLGQAFQVNTYTPDEQAVDAIAMSPTGEFVVTWSSYGQDGSYRGIFARRYGADGTPVGNEFQVNTYTPGMQVLSDVAMDADGNFVVTWSSQHQDGDGFGVYAQRFRADGVPLGNEFRVSTMTTGHQSDPAIAMRPNGTFAITWVSSHENGNNDIYVRQFAADGTPLAAGGGQGSSAEVRVNSYTRDSQSQPDIAVAATGDFVITWQSYGTLGTFHSNRDFDGYGIYAQRFRADGTRRGREFLVNTTTDDWQRSPTIAADAKGNWVITWISDQENNQTDIMAQHYRADGTPWGSEFRVNTQTQGDQMTPAIAAAPNGDFVIAWYSTNNYLSPQQATIFARPYDTPNIIVGTRFDDSLKGDDGIDYMSGLGGNDALSGGNGMDRLDGGDGNDALVGNAGDDFLLGGAGDDELEGGSGNDSLFGNEGNDSLAGQSGDDYLQGDAGMDRLFGGTGTDTLNGAAGDDYLDGGAGGDRLLGETGNDTYVVDDAADRVTEAANGGTDTVYATLSYTLPAHVEHLEFLGSENLTGIGNALSNTITAGDGDHVLEGGDGNDWLEGGAGDDRLRGGTGNDELLGGTGHDHLQGDEGHDDLDGGRGNDQVNGGAGEDVLGGGDGNDQLKGGDGDDILEGGDGDDYLKGHAHDDALFGGRGNDRLKAGSGDDVLIGSAVGVAPDGITDQTGEVDTLIGGSGRDRFVLGFDGAGDRPSTSFYIDADVRAADRLDERGDRHSSNHHSSTSKKTTFDGTRRYAVIKGFTPGEDQILLAQGAYRLDDSPIHGMSGTGIYQERSRNGSSQEDLIGVIKHLAPHELDLSNSRQFVMGAILFPPA